MTYNMISWHTKAPDERSIESNTSCLQPHPWIGDMSVLLEQRMHIAAELLDCDELVQFVIIHCPGQQAADLHQSWEHPQPRHREQNQVTTCRPGETGPL